MNTQRLIHDRQIAAGEYVRIWDGHDGRFLFERIMLTGRGVTIVCDSLEEAMSLWRQAERGVPGPLPPDILEERKRP